MIDNPHFKMPFQIAEGQTVMVEQDSPDEVAGCLTALLRTHRGERIDEPDYGIPDPTFKELSILDEIDAAIQEWEPRATFVLDEDDIDDMIDEIRVDLDAEGAR